LYERETPKYERREANNVIEVIATSTYRKKWKGNKILYIGEAQVRTGVRGENIIVILRNKQ
jgi:hypothetical protein